MMKILTIVDYVGEDRYVIDNSPASYMNHSCEPNCVCKDGKLLRKKYVYALRDIKFGEELTHDYTATAVDQFDGKRFWVLDCKCGAEKL